MLYRPLGRSGLTLSVIGFGTAWLRQVAEAQSLLALRTAFDLGINFVHTAPDYEGADELIARAVAESGKEIIVASQGYGVPSHFEHLFETTCAKLGKHRLELFGIACIDDREKLGEDVWGPAGMVQFLREKKRQGRLLASFCTTHGSPEYIRNLIESDAFDGIMLAYNPLGYHLLSHPEISPGDGERLNETPRLFTLAAQRGVGLMLMKTLAGGLLVPATNLQPHDATLIPPSPLNAGMVFRHLLCKHPEVTSLVPGMSSDAEVRENAAAGHEPLSVSPEETQAMEMAVSRLRANVCSRCGLCDNWCSRGLRVSWLFRAAHIENARLMVFETPLKLRYFDLHPERATAMCADCGNISCRCPYHIDIPASLIRVHRIMFDLIQRKRTLPSPITLEQRPEFSAVLLGWDRDEDRRPGQIACCRMNFQNTGAVAWELAPHKPKVSLEVMHADVLLHNLPVRNDVGTDMPCQFTFPLDPEIAVAELSFALLMWNPTQANLIHRLDLGDLTRLTQGAHAMYRMHFESHTIPATVKQGSTCEAEVVIRNDSDVVWKTDDPHALLTLVVWIDGVYMNTALLPQPTVQPGQRVTVPISFRAPQQLGPLLVKCDLVQQNITLFEDQGAAPLRLKLIAVDTDANDAGLASAWPKYDMEVTRHAAPKSVTPGARFCLGLQIENTGSFTWDCAAGSQNLVNLIVQHRGRVVGFSRLAHAVAPRQRIDVHLTVLAPLDTGEHQLQVGLVHENVALFSDQGVTPWPLGLMVEGQAVVDDQAYELLRDCNAWFYQPSGGASIGVDGGRHYPVTVTRAKGCYLWDGSGRRIIDYTNAWGTALLGHAYEPVQNAIREVLDTGVLSPLPYRLEAEVTEMLCAAIPCAESLAFGKNGSDVCTLAVRLARVGTGRKTILYCGFHGWQDWYMEAGGFANTGVPEPARRLIHRFRFNDIGDFRKLLDEHRADVAAVMLEPSGPSGEPPFGLGEAIDPTFLQAVAYETRAAGALLIFDEIITGFRTPGGSVQKETGIIPDLACFGKALANGMPLAALVGRRDVFLSMSRTAYGPTYKGDLYSLAAAKAALTSFSQLPVAETIRMIGEQLKTTLTVIAREYDLPAVVVGPPFRFGLFFESEDEATRLCLTTLYTQELLKGGLLPYKNLMLPSYAHDEEALNASTAIIRNALQCVRKAIDSNDLHSFIEIPLLL